MNRETVVKGIKEKGPAFLLGAIVGAAIITAFVNREKITKTVEIHTIGIGAGPHCDGQVLVINDLVGLSPEPIPKFVKRYANLREIMEVSIKEFRDEVRDGTFPSINHSYS